MNSGISIIKIGQKSGNPVPDLFHFDDALVEYSYNAEDYRVGKRVVDTNGVEVIQYFYEGDRVLFETDGTGRITAYNLYGNHLISRSVQGEQYIYLYNAHGDVVMLMDAGSGAIAATYRYDAFGNLLQQTGDVDNNITYAGYQYDEETGLYYLNARYYNSNTGRFLTEDTYRGRQQDPLSLHRYTYCHNNPLIYWDPTGHVAKKYKEDYFYSVTTGQIHPECEIGSAGSYVYQMERMLECAGYRTGNSEDSIFDGNTLQAVRLFQRDNGLEVTGIVEQKAWAYLKIQPQLKKLETRYKCNSISKEEYEAQVFKLKIMADRVPYMYDDRSLEVLQYKMLACYAYGAVAAASMIEVATMVLTLGASEALGDAADLILDLPKAIVNPTPDTIGSAAFDAACLLLPDGPLNYADEVDDIADLGKRAGKTSYGESSGNLEKVINVMKEGEMSSNGRRITYQLDDSTRIVFGLDLGENAHPLRNHGYMTPVNHMNVEIQTIAESGNVYTKWDMHMLLDDDNIVTKTLITGPWKDR